MIYAFSTFAFDASALELTRAGRRVALEPQPARALLALVERGGGVVTRDEMRQAIWGADTHVDYDRGLAYCVGQVRQALGDNAETPRFVQTLPKRGFRFIAPVTAVGPAVSGPRAVGPLDSALPEPAVPDLSPPPPPPAARSAARWQRSWILAVAGLLLVAAIAGVARRRGSDLQVVVAVSVFDNESGDSAHDAFVTNLADVVVTELTKLAPGRLGVVGNEAALRQPRNIRNLKALAQAVDADYVVLGQLQRQDERLRFIVHFIRLSDGVHLSAQRFVRPAAEVASFELDVLAEAARVVRAFALDPAGA